MYGTENYGEQLYAQDPELSPEEREQYRDLKHYLPQFMTDFAEMSALLEAQGFEVGLAWYRLNDLIQQCFVDTATWGLIRWEEEYGIDTNWTLSYERRREIIKAKMRGAGTTTAERIRLVAEAFSGGKCIVIEHNDRYYFVIKFVGTWGIPQNMQALIAQIEEIKPAHLGFGFDYRYVKWRSLRPVTWGSLQGYSWTGVRQNKGGWETVEE